MYLYGWYVDIFNKNIMTEKEKQIVNLFNSGENVTNIYKVTGCSHRSVYKILAKYDIDFPIKKRCISSER